MTAEKETLTATYLLRASTILQSPKTQGHTMSSIFLKYHKSTGLLV